MNSRVQQQYEFGPFQLDAANHSLLRDGQLVQLTPKAFDLLEVLVQNNGRLIEKDELLKEVWPDSFVEEGNINRNISIIRKVLGEDATGKPYIETVPKRGYRFVASVKTTNENGAGRVVELADQDPDNDLNTASLIPSHPHPAFGHPLPRGEGLGVRGKPQPSDAHANLLISPDLEAFRDRPGKQCRKGSSSFIASLACSRWDRCAGCWDRGVPSHEASGNGTPRHQVYRRASTTESLE